MFFINLKLTSGAFPFQISTRFEAFSLKWSTPQLGQFAELEKELKDLAINVPYIIKHSADGLPTKVFLGTVGGEDGRWVYPNDEYYHPVSNEEGIAVNFTEKFIQALDFIDYLETTYNPNDTVNGAKIADVVKGLKIYMLGVHAHESRHGIDYKTHPTRDLAYLARHPDRKKWNGLVPKDIIKNELRVIVNDFELSGFHLNYLYYKGHESKLELAGNFLIAWHESEKELFKDFGFTDEKGVHRNFSLLKSLEDNDFASYYVLDDASISKDVPFPKDGEFSFSMVGSMINAYMHSQYVPLEALWNLKELNDACAAQKKTADVCQKESTEIEKSWNLYMDSDKTQALLKTHEMLNDVLARWKKEKARLETLTRRDKEF